MTNPNPGAPAVDDFPEADLPASDELGPVTPQGNLGDTAESQPIETTIETTNEVPYNPAGTRADGGGAPSGGMPPISPEAPGGVAGGGVEGELGGEAGGPGNPQGVD
ncbi:MAG TPA: hypothetical protein VF116_07205 [Ktedonobacterales bacterium]